MAKYPEHEKLKARQADALLLSGFIDFLNERGWNIAEYTEDSDRLWAIRERPEEIIGLFLEIDPKKLSKEKDAMYAELIAAHVNTQRTGSGKRR
jgi:hypothetical protein